MKKLLILLTIFVFSSCSPATTAQKEAEKTLKQKSASERINSTNSNSDNLFKEIDQ